MDFLPSPFLPSTFGFLDGEVSDLQVCFRLRYDYFVEERDWVAANPHEPGVERDAYDDHALHLAVSDEHGIAAYLRLLPFSPEIGFMIDHDLACVLSEEVRYNLPREDAAEISRFVVRPSYEPLSWMPFHPIELLFKRFYQEAKARGLVRFYIVVEPCWIRLFARRFGVNFRVLGQPYIFPDGTRTVVATATMEELEDGMQGHSATKWAWYAQDEGTPNYQGSGPLNARRVLQETVAAPRLITKTPQNDTSTPPSSI